MSDSSTQISNFVIAGLTCYGIIKLGSYIFSNKQEEEATAPGVKKINPELKEKRLIRARELKAKADERLKALEKK